LLEQINYQWNINLQLPNLLLVSLDVVKKRHYLPKNQEAVPAEEVFHQEALRNSEGTARCSTFI